MNAEQREIFRQVILDTLDANQTDRFGLSAKAIALQLRPAGFRPEVAEVDRELRYLMDKGYVQTVGKPLSGLHNYQITATGRDLLDQ